METDAVNVPFHQPLKLNYSPGCTEPSMSSISSNGKTYLFCIIPCMLPSRAYRQKPSKTRAMVIGPLSPNGHGVHPRCFNCLSYRET
jgi:hypothetical protein